MKYGNDTITIEQVVASAKMDLGMMDDTRYDILFEKWVNEGVRHLAANSLFVKVPCIVELKAGEKEICLPSGFKKILGMRLIIDQPVEVSSTTTFTTSTSNVIVDPGTPNVYWVYFVKGNAPDQEWYLRQTIDGVTSEISFFHVPNILSPNGSYYDAVDYANNFINAQASQNQDIKYTSSGPYQDDNGDWYIEITTLDVTVEFSIIATYDNASVLQQTFGTPPVYQTVTTTVPTTTQSTASSSKTPINRCIPILIADKRFLSDCGCEDLGVYDDIISMATIVGNRVVFNTSYEHDAKVEISYIGFYKDPNDCMLYILADYERALSAYARMKFLQAYPERKGQYTTMLLQLASREWVNQKAWVKGVAAKNSFDNNKYEISRLAKAWFSNQNVI